MTDASGQRAEAMLRTIGCYPWPYRVELLLEYATTARQEALQGAVSIVEDWPLGIEDRLGLLDRLAREGRE